MLGTRILTAAVLLPLVLAALFLLSAPLWGAVALVAIVAGAVEWGELAGFRRPARWWFAGSTLVLGAGLLLAGWGGETRGWPDALVLAVCGATTAFWALVAPPWLRFHWKPSTPIVAVATGWLVLIGTWMAVVLLQSRSPWLLLAAMALVWIADSAAYFSGRAFGRHKLAPEISPGKTWEGVWGALIAVTCYALALVPMAGAAGFRGSVGAATIAAWLAVALALTALSVEGDLFESLLKRQAGVKDSGKLLPGHGGVLDRIDALLAAMPAAALVAIVFLK